MTRRGMTLAECLIALVVSSLLVASIDATLLAGQRFTRAETAMRGLRQNLRAASAVLRSELGAAAATGDLLAVSDTAVVLRAQRAFGVVCAVPSPGTLVLDDSLLTEVRAIDPTRDSALVFAEKDPLTRSDDGWIAGAVTQVRRGTCPGGASATVVTVQAAPGAFAGVGAGAAVRVFEIAEYRRYRDASGLWWFGVRNPSGAGWSASSPIAGPLVPRTGLALRYYTSALTRTGAADSVALIEADFHFRDARSFTVAGRMAGVLEDSLTVRVFVGP